MTDPGFDVQHAFEYGDTTVHGKIEVVFWGGGFVQRVRLSPGNAKLLGIKLQREAEVSLRQRKKT